MEVKKVFKEVAYALELSGEDIRRFKAVIGQLSTAELAERAGCSVSDADVLYEMYKVFNSASKVQPSKE